ncbi:pyridoxamine 5'-phosphate oxidase family protein [Paenibacillus sp. MBLB4367]|uniref:pyridoxamine 5'-phosphate oxidase family protein n=1 Tax=Paenibacillus sp. MBLB4367 TaxID=3384767 RepID=UPI0039081ECC
MAETLTALPEQLISILQRETIVMLNTVDADNGSPTVSAISWIYPVDGGKLRFAIDQRSRIIANIQKTPIVSLSFFGGGTLNAVYGETTIIAETLAEVPLKLACIEVNVTAVREAMFYGARVSVDPEYVKTYDKRAADKLDGQVFDAIKKA